MEMIKSSLLETHFPIGQTEKVIAMLIEAQSAMRTLRKKQITLWQDSEKFHRGLNLVLRISETPLGRNRRWKKDMPSRETSTKKGTKEDKACLGIQVG